MVEPKATKKIFLNSIEISESNVRDPKDIVGIEDLKLSISKYGVLQPIIVMEIEEDVKYELFIGQRRYVACKELGEEKIPARIYDKDSLSAQDQMILSLSENIQRRPLNKGDEIKVITKLYDELGSTERVVEELGISPGKVSESLNLERFMTNRIQTLLNEGWLNKGQLKAIIKLAEGNKDKVRASIKKVSKIIRSEDYASRQIMSAYKIAVTEPDISDEKLKEKIEKQRFEDRIILYLPYGESKALKQAAIESTGDFRDLILEIIHNWLAERELVNE